MTTLAEVRAPKWVFGVRLGRRQAGAEALLLALWTFAPWAATGPAKVFCSNVALAKRLGAPLGTIEKRLRALRAAGWIRPTLVESDRQGWVPGHELAWRGAGEFEVSAEASADEVRVPGWVLALRLGSRQAGAEALLAGLWTFAAWGAEGPSTVACTVDELAALLHTPVSTIEKRLRALKLEGLIQATVVQVGSKLAHGYALGWVPTEPPSEPPTAIEADADSGLPSVAVETLDGGSGPSVAVASLEGGEHPSVAVASLDDARPPPGQARTAVEGGRAPPKAADPDRHSRPTQPPFEVQPTAIDGAADRHRGRRDPIRINSEQIRSERGARTSSVGSRAARPTALEEFVRAVLVCFEQTLARLVDEPHIWPAVERWQEGECDLADVERVLAYYQQNRHTLPQGPIRLFERRTWSWTKTTILGRSHGPTRARGSRQVGPERDWDHAATRSLSDQQINADFDDDSPRPEADR